MTDGEVFTGKLLNQGPYSLQMLDSQGQLIALQRSKVREAGFTKLLRCLLTAISLVLWSSPT